jgi:hypothetical protein
MSNCPNECNGNGLCGVTPNQRGHPYLPSVLPGKCYCDPGWTGDDCSVLKAADLSAIVVESGNERNSELAVPGNVMKLMLVSPENLLSLQFSQFRIGQKEVTGYFIVPECGAAPCRVWNIEYTVDEDDFGGFSFVLDYTDMNNRPGRATEKDKFVRGKVTVTSFAFGARYWRVRALTIARGGFTDEFSWKMNSLRLYDGYNRTEPVNMADAVPIASSEAAHTGGFLGSETQIMNTTSNRYVYAAGKASSDPAKMLHKMLDYPANGYGRRAYDRFSKKNFGLGSLHQCLAACDTVRHCSAVTYSSSTKRPGCFLHEHLDDGAADSFVGEVTYFRTEKPCPPDAILTCDGQCIRDWTCFNNTQLPLRSHSCVETMGRSSCLPGQDQYWNCPLHGCNHGDCDLCGSDRIKLGQDMSNGMANHAVDVYYSHFWEAAENSAGEWIAVAFPEARVVRSLYVQHVDFRSAPMSAIVEQSNDMVNWQPVVVLDDFAVSEYAANLPSATMLAEGHHGEGLREFDLDELNLVELEGSRVFIPTVSFCYYTLDSAMSMPGFDFTSYASYDQPTPQLASKFYVHRNNTSLTGLPPKKKWNPTVADFHKCEDFPEWEDLHGDACKSYREHQWCTESGLVGKGWDFDWGTLEDYSKGGMSALEACCSCGGGQQSGAVSDDSKLNDLSLVSVEKKATAPISMLQVSTERQSVTSSDIASDRMDEFGCLVSEGYTWCPYTMKCVQDYEGGDGGPCRPPQPVPMAPKTPAIAFVFHDESKVPGKIRGRVSIIPAYADNLNQRITHYAVYFSRGGSGMLGDTIGNPVVVVEKGPQVIVATIPLVEVPQGATHLTLFTRNGPIDMPWGITRKLDEQLNIYGDLGTYRTKSCAVWRRNGPNYYDMQGMTLMPAQNFYRGKNMTIRISGLLHCADVRDVSNTQMGRGKATVRWVLFHTPDGSNVNGRVLPEDDGPDFDSVATGTFDIDAGTCSGHPDGVPVHAHVRRYQGGHVALWMKLEWHGEDNGNDYAMVCDSLTYEIVQGKTRIADEAASVNDSGFYCKGKCPEPSSDHVLQLEYHVASKFSGGCSSDEGRVCTSEWIASGCQSRPPFLFGLNCHDYKQCYVRAMQEGKCGSDMADADCDSVSAKICVNDWVAAGCPDSPPDQCVQYEECAVAAMLAGRCPAPEVNCSKPVAANCVKEWVNKRCGPYPAEGSVGCEPYESCATKAMNHGRCSQFQVDCGSRDARLCVDNYVVEGCPGLLSDVQGLNCSDYHVCAKLAERAGRCRNETEGDEGDSSGSGQDEVPTAAGGGSVPTDSDVAEFQNSTAGVVTNLGSTVGNNALGAMNAMGDVSTAGLSASNDMAVASINAGTEASQNAVDAAAVTANSANGAANGVVSAINDGLSSSSLMQTRAHRRGWGRRTHKPDVPLVDLTRQQAFHATRMQNFDAVARDHDRSASLHVAQNVQVGVSKQLPTGSLKRSEAPVHHTDSVIRKPRHTTTANKWVTQSNQVAPKLPSASQEATVAAVAAPKPEVHLKDYKAMNDRMKDDFIARLASRKLTAAVPSLSAAAAAAPKPKPAAHVASPPSVVRAAAKAAEGVAGGQAGVSGESKQVDWAQHNAQVRQEFLKKAADRKRM